MRKIHFIKISQKIIGLDCSIYSDLNKLKRAIVLNIIKYQNKNRTYDPIIRKRKHLKSRFF
jgi:myosin heavy subunit